MKKLILIALIGLMLISAKGRAGGNLAGWFVNGQVKVVRDAPPGGFGKFSAEGYGAGGVLSQSVNIPAGFYDTVVWCKGAGSFTLSQTPSGYTETLTCNSSVWTPLTFIGQNLFPAGTMNIVIRLQAGDYADQICLFPVDLISGGYCPPSLLSNFSFEGK